MRSSSFVSQKRGQSLLKIEALETRLVPATLVDPVTVTYLDFDTDLVTVTLSKGSLNGGKADQVFTFDTGSVDGDNTSPQQLQLIDLSFLGNQANGVDLTVTVSLGAGGGADGRVNIGAVLSEDDSLGGVTIPGDLGRIVVNTNGNKPNALRELNVRSMGQFGLTTQGATGDLHSICNGSVGALTVTLDMTGVYFEVLANGNGQGGGGISSITFGGSLIGGTLDNTGTIRCAGNVGPVQIGGTLQGSSGADSGSLHVAGDMESLRVVGQFQGGLGARSGSMRIGGGCGPLVLLGDLVGSDGPSSGSLTVDGDCTSLTVGGSALPAGLIGGGTDLAGSVTIQGAVGTVSIFGGIVGGSGASSGRLLLGATVTKLTVTGTIQGGSGAFSGLVHVVGLCGPVKIGGDIRGGQGNSSGGIFFPGGVGKIAVSGNVIGGDNNGSGDVNLTGFIQAKRIPVLTIIGRMESGENLAAGTLTNSGAIRSANDIGKLTIGGGVLGNATAPVIISARGLEVPTATADAAIKKVSIIGSAEYFNILAGYDFNGAGINGDAQIKKVKVTGSWTAGNIAAGVGAGADALFGTDDDVLFPAGPDGSIAKIGKVKILLAADGTAAANDHFGFVSHTVTSVKCNGVAAVLSPGLDNVALGTTGDFRAREF